MKQAQTAIEVYHHDIEPDLARRQQFVVEQLQAFLEKHRSGPTAQELLRFIVARFHLERFDVNSVRPRLTELEEQGRVRHGVKRPCDVTGKTVYTWLPATPTDGIRHTSAYHEQTLF